MHDRQASIWPTAVTMSRAARVCVCVCDLNKERGIVRMRVTLCHDLLRLSLSSGDLYVINTSFFNTPLSRVRQGGFTRSWRDNKLHGQ